MNLQETVYLYRPAPADWEGKLTAALLLLHVRMRKIPDAQIAQTVGHLVGLPGHDAKLETNAVPTPPDPVLLLHGFSQSRLNALLPALRKAGVPRDVLKAVVTEHNVDWPFHKLCEELQKEHEAMQQNPTAP